MNVLNGKGAARFHCFLCLAFILFTCRGSIWAGSLPRAMTLVLNPGTPVSRTVSFFPAGETVRKQTMDLSGAMSGLIASVNRTKKPSAGKEPLPAHDKRGGETIPVKPHLPKDAHEYSNRFSLNAGYRNDKLFWTIADSDNEPNILSELIWDNLHSSVVSGQFRWSNSRHLYIRGGIEIGAIAGGENQDSDYGKSNRVEEFSRSHADTGGSMFDASLGVGFRFDIPWRLSPAPLRIIPLAGYSFHNQELENTNGVQVVSAHGNTMPLGPFPGLQSEYDAQWKGPWIGFDIEVPMGDHHGITAGFEYHRIRYEAEADWNLRTSFAHPVSFRHRADGEGCFFSLGYWYKLSDRWKLNLSGNYRALDTDPGTDTTYFSDGSQGSTGLNEVQWKSWGVSLGFSYEF
ncbi:MAG: omptin family outer membrane protease [Desulfobacter sp.]|nr:MAG: omptin family outer membrane protease [Desulfobacter sp.]